VRRAGRIIIAIVTVLVLLVVGVLVWAHMVMGGERPASLRAWRDPAVTISMTGHSLVMRPTGEDSGVGLVFIPGAKVDPSAYLYKLSGIVHRGVTVVITKPTLNLAFFDTRPLSAFTTDAPAVTRWFVGGHSLGGVRACQLADGPGVNGLILFGSYCANDLSSSTLTVLSISGSRDGLSTPQKIADARPLLPDSARFVVIRGADHASFGDYGPQPGDNPATITSARARAEITRALHTVLP
jgi:hypothetical protein